MKKLKAGGTLNETTFSIDTALSDVSFSVSHPMITQIKGFFTRFEGSIASSYPNFSDARIQVQIDAGSILTNHPDRDQHLRAEDFSAVDRFPFIRFQSSSLL
jgi:polyisoprenoid-binding protein YceI